MLPVLYHDHGHPVRRVHVFPDEILEKQEGLHQEVLQQATKCVRAITQCEAVLRYLLVCVCVSACTSTYHKIRGFSESLYVCGIVTIIHLTEDSCHARHHSGLEKQNMNVRQRGGRGWRTITFSKCAAALKLCAGLGRPGHLNHVLLPHRIRLPEESFKENVFCRFPNLTQKLHFSANGTHTASRRAI